QAILRSTMRDLKESVGNTARGSLVGIAMEEHTEGLGYAEYQRSQCLPLYTLLKAIGKDHVDLISLDVEGAEMGVLKSLPWHKMTVDVWMIEHRSINQEGNLFNQLDQNFI
ncbi:unnamed protein product, partial [Meganyctiphanes norvegica]